MAHLVLNESGQGVIQHSYPGKSMPCQKQSTCSDAVTRMGQMDRETKMTLWGEKERQGNKFLKKYPLTPVHHVISQDEKDFDSL